MRKDLTNGDLLDMPEGSAIKEMWNCGGNYPGKRHSEYTGMRQI